MDTSPTTNLTQSSSDFYEEIDLFLNTKKLKFPVKYDYEPPEDLTFTSLNVKEPVKEKPLEITIKNERKRGKSKKTIF